jgi:signal peptidase II
MATRSSAGMLPWLALAFVVVLADQFSKWLVVGHFVHGDSMKVLDFFSLVRAHNSGAAFSFLSSAGGWQRWLFIGIGVAAAALILWMLRSHAGQKLLAFALASILGGAIGNLIDRLMHGYVVDFIDLHWHDWHFPAFNVADSAISVGAVCLILDEILRLRRSR